MQRREPMRSGWFDLSLVAAAGLSVVAASVAVKLIGDHGGYSVLAVPTGLATTGMMPGHVWLAAEGVLGVYGADFFGLTGPGSAETAARKGRKGGSRRCFPRSGWRGSSGAQHA